MYFPSQLLVHQYRALILTLERDITAPMAPREAELLDRLACGQFKLSGMGTEEAAHVLIISRRKFLLGAKHGLIAPVRPQVAGMIGGQTLIPRGSSWRYRLAHVATSPISKYRTVIAMDSS